MVSSSSSAAAKVIGFPVTRSLMFPGTATGFLSTPPFRRRPLVLSSSSCFSCSWSSAALIALHCQAVEATHYVFCAATEKRVLYGMSPNMANNEWSVCTRVLNEIWRDDSTCNVPLTGFVLLLLSGRPNENRSSVDGSV